MASFIAVFLIISLVIALLWWLLITTEGVYLGRTIVIWLYDVYARRYDRIKEYDPDWESASLGEPILRWLRDIPAPLILDVATGTARLPATLIAQPQFTGQVIGLDFSRRMLAIAAQKLAGSGVDFIYQSAEHLPFDDDTFDAVTCLEALEFMPNPEAALLELIRVVRPGGLILITNRRGFGAWMMPGKTQSSIDAGIHLRDDFEFEDVAVTIWLANYDLVRGFKPGIVVPRQPANLLSVLRCPCCGKSALTHTDRKFVCGECQAEIPIAEDGVILYADSKANSAGG
jgi:SAM-dependent methyltransferase